MLESSEWRIQLLAGWGFHAKAIAGLVKKYDGEPLSVGQVYGVCKKHGIRLRDYRDGIGHSAEFVERQVIRDLKSEQSPLVATRYHVAAKPPKRKKHRKAG